MKNSEVMNLPGMNEITNLVQDLIARGVTFKQIIEIIKDVL